MRINLYCDPPRIFISVSMPFTSFCRRYMLRTYRKPYSGIHPIVKKHTAQYILFAVALCRVKCSLLRFPIHWKTPAWWRQKGHFFGLREVIESLGIYLTYKTYVKPSTETQCALSHTCSFYILTGDWTVIFPALQQQVKWHKALTKQIYRLYPIYLLGVREMLNTCSYWIKLPWKKWNETLKWI